MGEHLLCTQGVASSNLVASTIREKGSHRTVLALALLLAGCAAKGVRTGLVLEEADEIYLVTQPGERTRLVLDGQATAVKNLLGCRVEVGGQARLGGFAVDTYEVLDAGFGAPPHLGILQWSGGRLMMNDQNSGALIELVGSNAETLRMAIGSLVLVNGVVVGPHQVRVMNHRILVKNQDVTAE